VVICDVAVGDTLGVPVDRSTLYPAYCATKPLVPLAIAHLIDRTDLDLTRPVREFSARLNWVPRTASIADLLMHHAGMAEPSAGLWRMTPPDRRAGFFASPPETSGPAYSEVSSWLALAAVIEQMTAQRAEEFVESVILQPAGLIDDIIVSPDRATEAAEADRVQVPVAGLPLERVPLLSERLPQQLADVNLSFGGLINASGIGRLYSRVRQAMAGEIVDGMPTSSSLHELFRHRRRSVWDATLQRSCAFAGGFMVDLPEHGFGRTFPNAIGHSSGIVPHFGLCDTEREVAVACCLNGVSPASTDLEVMRSLVLAAALTDVASW
jgi:CubicO group peptidase (beta-lactamase class C family)